MVGHQDYRMNGIGALGLLVGDHNATRHMDGRKLTKQRGSCQVGNTLKIGNGADCSVAVSGLQVGKHSIINDLNHSPSASSGTFT